MFIDIFSNAIMPLHFVLLNFVVWKNLKFLLIYKKKITTDSPRNLKGNWTHWSVTTTNESARRTTITWSSSCTMRSSSWAGLSCKTSRWRRSLKICTCKLKTWWVCCIKLNIKKKSFKWSTMQLKHKL